MGSLINKLTSRQQHVLDEANKDPLNVYIARNLTGTISHYSHNGNTIKALIRKDILKVGAIERTSFFKKFYYVPMWLDMITPPPEIEIVGEIVLALGYWDCNCDRDYILPISHKACPRCGDTQEESATSRLNELIKNGITHYPKRITRRII